ncbi:MAG TPA: SRPBCC family protein [Solirubrobacterales bacterium]
MTSIDQETERRGGVEREGDDYVVRFERYLDHPVDSVWLALTEPGAIGKWLAAATTFELREGGTIELRWSGAEDGAGMRATITELDPPRLLEWSGGPPGHPAAACRWELRPEAHGCVLRFSSRVPVDEIDRKGAADPEHWSPPSMLAGWHVHLGYLEDVLDGRSVDLASPAMDAFYELYESYGGERR